MRGLIRKVNKLAILLLLGVGILSHSCIKEDLEDCVTHDFTLDFLYDYNEDDTDKFQNLVETVNLYIYTKAGALVSKEVITKAELVANNYKHTVNLMLGEYNAVAWMNLTSDYTVTNDNRFNTARLTAASPNDQIVNGMGDIYYGTKELIVKKEQLTRQETISLIKDTNLIDVDAHFDNELPDTIQIEIKITGTNGTYDFSNKSVMTEPSILYIPNYSVTTGEPEPQTNNAMFSTIQKMSSEDNLRLTITQKNIGGTSPILVDIMVTKYIMTNPKYNSNEKLDRYDNFHLEFFFKFDPGNGTFMIASIKVNDWIVKDSDIGIM